PTSHFPLHKTTYSSNTQTAEANDPVKGKSTAPTSCPPAPAVQRQPDPTPAFSLLLHVNRTAAGEGQDAAASLDVPNVKTGKSHSLPLPKAIHPRLFIQDSWDFR
ncbi:hypothetical protein AABB24_037306, partial [Solanum stoloniferum]